MGQAAQRVRRREHRDIVGLELLDDRRRNEASAKPPWTKTTEVAPRVRALCERYGLPYVSGPLPKQYAQVVRKILRMSLPRGGQATPDEAADATATRQDAILRLVA